MNLNVVPCHFFFLGESKLSHSSFLCLGWCQVFQAVQTHLWLMGLFSVICLSFEGDVITYNRRLFLLKINLTFWDVSSLWFRVDTLEVRMTIVISLLEKEQKINNDRCVMLAFSNNAWLGPLALILPVKVRQSWILKVFSGGKYRKLHVNSDDKGY